MREASSWVETRIWPCECELKGKESAENLDESWEAYKSLVQNLESSQKPFVPGSPQSPPNKYRSAYVDYRLLPALVAWVY